MAGQRRCRGSTKRFILTVSGHCLRQGGRRERNGSAYGRRMYDPREPTEKAVSDSYRSRSGSKQRRQVAVDAPSEGTKTAGWTSMLDRTPVSHVGIKSMPLTYLKGSWCQRRVWDTSYRLDGLGRVASEALASADTKSKTYTLSAAGPSMRRNRCGRIFLSFS